MAKKAQPWYWEERKSWYVTMNGRRHSLGEHPEGAARPVKSKKTGRWNTPAEIDEAFRRLLSGGAATEAGATPADGDYVSAPLQAFLKWCKQNRAATTTARYFDFLDSFERRWHTLTVDALTARHVTEWLDGQKGWNATTKRNAITALQRAFNWAVRNLGLAANPIKGMEKPQPRRRTEVVSPADFDALLAEVTDGPFRDLLVVSWDSGARPFELKDLEGRHVHAEQQRAVIPAAEAKGRRHVRTIYFPTERSMEVIRRLCAARPSGPLFLNRRERKWTGMAVKCRFEDLQTDLGVKEMERKGVGSQVTDEAVAELAKTLSPTRMSRKTGGEVTKKEKELLAEARRKLVAAEARPHAPRVTHYALRHSFVTRKLVAGVDSHVVASLAGHRDTSMVDRVYSHVADDARFMLEQAKKGG